MASPGLFTSVSAAEMLSTFQDVLSRNGFSEERARQCAEIFTDSSVDGVYTHGVNRFAKFIEYIQRGFIDAVATPALKNRSGNVEQWDGNFGPGPLNAAFATERAMQLANDAGIACVTLSNTNHWMRGGTYGWQAAKKGFIFIGFTNTIANMPAWGGKDKKLGNNPLVIAMPYKDEAIVLDMAMSQYSFGAMEMAKMKGEKLSAAGGFNKEGVLTNDPAEIIESGRLLPIGLWKGAGLSLLLDMLAAVLSGGLATHQITSKEAEYASQVFIAIKPSASTSAAMINEILNNILSDYSLSLTIDERSRIIYPGQRILETRSSNLRNGIPVLKEVWQSIGDL